MKICKDVLRSGVGTNRIESNIFHLFSLLSTLRDEEGPGIHREHMIITYTGHSRLSCIQEGKNSVWPKYEYDEGGRPGSIRMLDRSESVSCQKHPIGIRRKDIRDLSVCRTETGSEPGSLCPSLSESSRLDSRFVTAVVVVSVSQRCLPLLALESALSHLEAV